MDDPPGLGNDPDFIPVEDPEIYELDLTDPGVTEGIIDDDDYMLDEADQRSALNEPDAIRLNEFQTYPEIDQIIDY